MIYYECLKGNRIEISRKKRGDFYEGYYVGGY